MALKKKKGKQIVASKPTTVDGIHFKSMLEAYTYKKLKANNIPFAYEQNSYCLVPGFMPTLDYWENKNKVFKKKNNIKVQPITYTPDFTDPHGKWIIEVKGRPNESFPLRWKLFKRWLESPDEVLFVLPTLYLPTCQADVNITIQNIIDSQTKT